MALPVDGQLAFGDDLEAPFFPPRDKPRLFFEDWCRGGVGIQNPVQGLNVYDWHTFYNIETGQLSMEVEGVIDPILIYSFAEPIAEIAGGFDTNMQPVIGWTTDEGVSWFRWFDPLVPGFVNIQLAEGSKNIRITLDDVRDTQTITGVTDTIIAYVRRSKLYYRQLRDRFAIEIPVVGSEGMIALAQTGMNTNLRFQFSRSGFASENGSKLNFGRPENRGTMTPAMFDAYGNVDLYQGPDLHWVPGKAGRGKRRSFETATNVHSTYNLQLLDGSWAGGDTRRVSADFLETPQTPLGGRETTYTHDKQGVISIVPGSDLQHAEYPVRLKSVKDDASKTLTGMYIDTVGNGVTFNVASLTSVGTFGTFTPNYALTGDFITGQAPQNFVRYADYGPFVALSVPGMHVGASNGPLLRWPPGTIPPEVCPTADRNVPCVVTHSGITTIAGSATIHPDGSADFQVLTVINDGGPTTHYQYIPAGTEGVDSMSHPWVAQSDKIDLLLVGSGAAGGGGTGHVGGGGGAGGGVRVLENVSVVKGQTYQFVIPWGGHAGSSKGEAGQPTVMIGVQCANSGVETGGGGSFLADILENHGGRFATITLSPSYPKGGDGASGGGSTAKRSGEGTGDTGAVGEIGGNSVHAPCGDHVIPIPNGDFELGNNGDWTLGPRWTFTNENRYQGNYCLKWQGSHTDNASPNVRATMTNSVPIEPGQQITVTGYLNPNNGGANLSMMLMLCWYDSSDVFISETPDWTNSANWIQGGGYRQVSITQEAPMGAARVRVRLWASTGTSPNPGYADMISWNLGTGGSLSLGHDGGNGDATDAPGIALASGRGGGGGGAGGPGQDATISHAGDGGDPVNLSTLGWDDLAAEGAPTEFGGGGGGGGNGDVGVSAGDGGGSVGGDGALGPANGLDAATGTGSGGGGGGGDLGAGGRGSAGFVGIRWVSGETFQLLIPGTFPGSGLQKGLPAGFTLVYPKETVYVEPPVPPVIPDDRVTETGDRRVTEAGDHRITEV